MANALLSRYLHDSAMALTLTDALFDFSYMALNVGGTIQTGADVLTVEQVTTAEANKITVSETPQKFGNFGVIGWYSVVGEDNWTKITFDADSGTFSDPNTLSTILKGLGFEASIEQVTALANKLGASFNELTLSAQKYNLAKEGQRDGLMLNALSNSSIA